LVELSTQFTVTALATTPVKVGVPADVVAIGVVTELLANESFLSIPRAAATL
jgi:hypothetical protein